MVPYLNPWLPPTSSSKEPTLMDRTIGILGVPSSAGAFAPGQEEAPRVLRDAKLVERLETAGLTVADHGDTDKFRWRPDDDNPNAQNINEVVRIVEETARHVRNIVSAGQLPLVLGGDCTISLGTIEGSLMTDNRIGVIYFDLHPDLNTPATCTPGALDWMGMAHALGEENTLSQLRQVGSRVPLLDNNQVHFFSYGPENRTDGERDVMMRRNLDETAVDKVASAPETVARKVLTEFGSKFDRLLLHFDVDVIDFNDLPLSENTGQNEGLPFKDAMRALAVFLHHPKIDAITITEINPAHGEPDGKTINQFVDAFAEVIDE